ncbi:kinase-like domain, beta-lactamase/transpeptidase-like protein [Tanacetum coccineum]
MKTNDYKYHVRSNCKRLGKRLGTNKASHGPNDSMCLTNSLNWRFLIDIMKRMGFGDKWCKWVDSCLRSSTMSILVNGSPTEEFCLEKGVRQGDPLSPFLFILEAEYLNAIVNEAVRKGVKIGRNNVVCFEKVSGLRVNYNKSKLYGVGVSDAELSDMARWMKFGMGEIPFTYLGLPIGDNMSRVSAWNSVLEKFKSRIAYERRERVAEKKRILVDETFGNGKAKGLGNLRKWRWTIHESGDFTVKELTKVVEDYILDVDNGGDATIWNKWLPKKSIFCV